MPRGIAVSGASGLIGSRLTASLQQHGDTVCVKRAIYSSRIDGTALISEALARLKTPPRLLVSASATDYLRFDFPDIAGAIRHELRAA